LSMWIQHIKYYFVQIVYLQLLDFLVLEVLNVHTLLLAHQSFFSHI
jgi:hypothetical protein